MVVAWWQGAGGQLGVQQHVMAGCSNVVGQAHNLLNTSTPAGSTWWGGVQGTASPSTPQTHVTHTHTGTWLLLLPVCAWCRRGHG